MKTLNLAGLLDSTCLEQWGVFTPDCFIDHFSFDEAIDEHIPTPQDIVSMPVSEVRSRLAFVVNQAVRISNEEGCRRALLGGPTPWVMALATLLREQGIQPVQADFQQPTKPLREIP